MANDKRKPKNPKQPRLTPKQERLVEELAKPDVKSVRQAALAAGYAPTTATGNIYAIVENERISDAVRKRKERNLLHAGITREDILGSAAFQMNTSMADFLDDEQKLDLKQAVENGAIDVVKKIKETEKIVYDASTRETTTTIVREVELQTNGEARRELANYLGVEKFGNDRILTPTEKACDLAGDILRHMPGIELGKILGGVLQIYPSADRNVVENRIIELHEEHQVSMMET